MNKEQIKSVIQLLFGAGGPGAALVMSYGVEETRLTLWVNLALAIVPPLAMTIWALVERTHKGTLAAAGDILAKPTITGEKTGTIIVSPHASNGAKKAASDENVSNVDFGRITQSSWLIGMLAMILLLGGCATVQQTPSQAMALVDRITLIYMPVKTAAVLCSTGVLCKDEAAQAVAAKAIPIADDAVASAKQLILVNATDASAVLKWSAAALAAIEVLARAMSGIGVAAPPVPAALSTG